MKLLSKLWDYRGVGTAIAAPFHYTAVGASDDMETPPKRTTPISQLILRELARRDREWFLYCAETQDKRQVKIGITSNQHQRTIRLRGRHYRLNPVCWWELGVCSRRFAESVEISVHVAIGKRFDALGGERFDAPADDVLAIVDDTLAVMLPEMYGD